MPHAFYGDLDCDLPSAAGPRSESGRAGTRGGGGAGETLFCGDSITHFWETEGREVWSGRLAGWKPVDDGTAGDKTVPLLWRLKNTRFEGSTLRRMVLLIEVNDLLAGVPVERVDAGIAAILRLLLEKLPQAQVLLMGVFPYGAEPHPGRRDVEDLNRRLAGHAGGRVHFLDMGRDFVGERGHIPADLMHDGRHLSAETPCGPRDS